MQIQSQQWKLPPSRRISVVKPADKSQHREQPTRAVSEGEYQARHEYDSGQLGLNAQILNDIENSDMSYSDKRALSSYLQTAAMRPNQAGGQLIGVDIYV